MPLSLRTWLSQEGIFLPKDLIISLAELVKTKKVMDIFSRSVYQGCVCHVGVTRVSLLLHFPGEPCLSPDLSSYRVGMQNQTFCSSPAALHLLRNCSDLASMQYICEVSDTAWRQTDLLLGFLRLSLFSDKLSEEISNWMSLLHSWSPSLFWHFNCLKGTKQ